MFGCLDVWVTLHLCLGTYLEMQQAVNKHGFLPWKLYQQVCLHMPYRTTCTRTLQCCLDASWLLCRFCQFRNLRI